MLLFRSTVTLVCGLAVTLVWGFAVTLVCGLAVVHYILDGVRRSAISSYGSVLLCTTPITGNTVFYLAWCAFTNPLRGVGTVCVCGGYVRWVCAVCVGVWCARMCACVRGFCAQQTAKEEINAHHKDFLGASMLCGLLSGSTVPPAPAVLFLR